MSYEHSFSTRSLGSFSRASRTIPRQGTSHFGFGSASVRAIPVSAVTVNKKLLVPVQLDLDPDVHAQRLHEKEQIKGLNNRFATFINKVRILEQENKMLETKLQLLQSETPPPSNLEPMLKAYITTLQAQLDGLNRDKEHLNTELLHVRRQVDDNKHRYEDELNKRNMAENEFVVLKKNADAAYLSKTDLEEQAAGIQDDLHFFKRFYDEELRELSSQVKDTSVVVQMDNSRMLNMEQIVAEVKSQYEEVAARGKEEAEAWYKNKIELASSQAEQYSSELKMTKTEISELRKQVTRLQTEVTSAKAQRDCVERQVKESESRAEEVVRDAQRRIKELEEGLQKAKQKMAAQVREYQDLMNIKLALDIEIATYKRLLEGEESRIGQDATVRVQTVEKTNF